MNIFQVHDYTGTNLTFVITHYIMSITESVLGLSSLCCQVVLIVSMMSVRPHTHSENEEYEASVRMRSVRYHTHSEYEECEVSY